MAIWVRMFHSSDRMDLASPCQGTASWDSSGESFKASRTDEPLKPDATRQKKDATTDAANNASGRHRCLVQRPTIPGYAKPSAGRRIAMATRKRDSAEGDRLEGITMDMADST